ncbi:MAG: WXG100 family type VII secretion target [Mycobacterium sp.]|nr:WXG100 family type VII secretion target [Mycobacterium sp.]
MLVGYEFGGRMGESVEVATSELHLAADRLRGAGQRLQDGLSAVDLETGNLLAAGWKGEAATAFDTYWERWHNGAGQVVRALQTMSEALDAAGTNYQAADEQARDALGSTMQAGGGSGAGRRGPSGGPAGGCAGAEDTSARPAHRPVWQSR